MSWRMRPGSEKLEFGDIAPEWSAEVNMAVACKTQSHNFSSGVFLIELHRRIKPLPIKSSSGNECVAIELADCPDEFVTQVDAFLADNEQSLKLALKGQRYVVEVVECNTFRRPC